MSLNVENVVVSVQKINARKEGKPEDKELAVDLTLELHALAKDVLPSFDPSLRSLLFHHGHVRFAHIESIDWKGEMTNMGLDIFGFSFRSVRLSKFKIFPYIHPKGSDTEHFDDTHCAKIVLNAFIRPTGTEVATIAEMLGENTQANIYSRQQEMEV